MMALMMGKLYTALRSANVPEDRAREAAEEVAAFDHDLADVKSTQRLHSWMLTFNTAMLVALVVHAFLPH